MSDQLWDDDRILYWIDDCVYATGDGAQAAHAIACEIRDEYEAVLEFDRTRYAEQQARIATLGQQLQRARKWLPDSVLEGSDDDD